MPSSSTSALVSAANISVVYGPAGYAAADPRLSNRSTR
jgi:hypothetical protein